MAKNKKSFPPSIPIPPAHRAEMDRIKAKKLSKDEIQDRRDKLIIGSYGRTLAQLASVHGGSFAAEKIRLSDELEALEKLG